MENNRFCDEIYSKKFMNNNYFEKLHIKIVFSI